MDFWPCRSKGGHYDSVSDKDKDNESELGLSREDDVSQQAVWRLKCWLWTMSVIAIIACLILASVGGNALLLKQQSYHHRSVSPVPNMPTGTVLFDRDERYASTSDSESDRAWVSLMPAGGGFVSLHNPAAFNLPPGLPDQKNASLYDVSLFHQLHCLTQLRSHLFTLDFALEKNETEKTWVQDVLLAPQRDHVLHCFDYLRQAVMCAGDLTLEWPRQEADGRRFAFDGWKVKHECSSWDAIQHFMSEHRPSYVV